MNVVIALMGLPGSGKSSVAKALRERVPLALVSRDAIRAAMFDPCEHNDLEKHAAHEAAMLSIEHCLALGRSCVIDGMTFSRNVDVERVRAMSRKTGAHFMPVFFDCPVEIAQERIRKDVRTTNNVHRSGEEELVAKVAERFELPPEDAIVIDCTLDPHVLAGHLVAHIERVAPEAISS
jgi:predicted kinase